jgi:hypothetical protein
MNARVYLVNPTLVREKNVYIELSFFINLGNLSSYIRVSKHEEKKQTCQYSWSENHESSRCLRIPLDLFIKTFDQRCHYETNEMLSMENNDWWKVLLHWLIKRWVIHEITRALQIPTHIHIHRKILVMYFFKDYFSNILFLFIESF